MAWYDEETEDERLVREAAEDVHRRLRVRSAREDDRGAVFLPASTSRAIAMPASSRPAVAPSSSSRAPAPRTPEPPASPWRDDVANDADADRRRLALARDVAARTGATPDLSRKVARDVMDAERKAVLAAVGPLLAASETRRASPPSAGSEFSFRGGERASRSGSRDAANAANHHHRSPRTDDDDDGAGGMSAALWEMARTPPPEEVRRALGYRSFGVNAAARGGFGSDDDAGGGRGGRRGGGKGEGEKDVEAWTREYDENDDVARRATTTATDAWAHSMDARRRLARIAAATKDAAMYGMHRLDLEKNPTGTTPPRLSLATGGTGGAEEASPLEASGSALAEEFASMLDAIASRPASPPGGDARSLNARSPLPRHWAPAGEREREAASDGGGGGGAYGEGDGDSDRWSPEDAANVRAARAAAWRAETAARAIVEEERRVRESVGVSVGELLDARVELAAATARAVSEEAAMSVVAVAAEAASLRMTVNERARGGDPDEPTAAKLAEYLEQPLPVVEKIVAS